MKQTPFCAVAASAVATLLVPAMNLQSVVRADESAPDATPQYRGLLGQDNPKIKVEGDKVFVWSGGDKPPSPKAQWYDFTGAPFPADKLQFGIGKDRIRAIDDPLFVSPTDPRLMSIPVSPYREDETHASNDDLMVIGWIEGQDVRAYPIALLDRHELVNDRIGGKPVTVGW